MGRINARSKGAAGEREFCNWLFETFCFDKKPERNLDQVRSGGCDVICPPFAFEVKRQENIQKVKWWGQVRTAIKDKDSRAFNLIPVVAYRQNTKPWHFLVPSTFLQIQPDHGFIELTERVFVKWVNEVVIPGEAVIHKNKYLDYASPNFISKSKNYSNAIR